MHFIHLYIFLFIGGTLFAQGEKHVYTDKQLTIEYHTKNGLLYGKYSSHYANGKKKSEGHFKNNLRDGKWLVWDSTEKINYVYNVPPDTLKRNADGFFDFPHLKQQDVVIEKRVWRNINPENNMILFSRASLFDSLYDQIQKDSLIIFKDEEYQAARSKEDTKKVLGTGKFEITGYKTKEDWFFDKKTGAASSRIIGIYLVLKPKGPDREENIGLGWIYYPSARKYFAKEKVHEKGLPFANLDDVFFFRYYYAQIYKEMNIYDRPIAVYEKTEERAAKEAERIELSMIEMEHDIWINNKKQ